MEHRHTSADGTGDLPRPTEFAGAGPLTSAVWKLGSESSGWSYRFNLMRKPDDVADGECSSAVGGSRYRHVPPVFQPTDLVPFVRLAQVLATVIADDGCLEPADRTMLRNLAEKLNDVFGDATLETEIDTVSAK